MRRWTSTSGCVHEASAGCGARVSARSVPDGTLGPVRTFEHSTDIPAPVSTVWAATIDIERWPGLTPTVTAVERLDGGPIRMGSRARVRQPGQPKRVWTVTNLEPVHLFAWATNAFGLRMVAYHELTELAPDVTRNRLTVDLAGPMAGLVAVLAGRRLRRTLELENGGFRLACTRTSSTT
jgi:hypothetical protein